MRRDGAGVEGRWGLAESRRALQSSEGPSVSPRGLSEGLLVVASGGSCGDSRTALLAVWVNCGCTETAFLTFLLGRKNCAPGVALGGLLSSGFTEHLSVKWGHISLSRVKCALVPVLGRRSLSAACWERGPRVDKGGDHRTLVSLMANFRYFRNSK